MHRLHVVKWRDAHGIKTEAGKGEVLAVHKPAIYWSAGILVLSDERGVTLASDLGMPLGDDYETTYRTRTFIPRVLIDDEYDAGALIRRKRKAVKDELGVLQDRLRDERWKPVTDE